MYIVYQITNSVNGKRYVGYSKHSLARRLSIHRADARKGSDYTFHKAIRKYPWPAFRAEVLCVEDTLAGAKESETLYILDTNPEYNSTLGGDGGPVNPKKGDEHYTRSVGFVHHNLGKKGWLSPLKGRKRPAQAKKMVGSNNPCYGKPVTKKVSVAIADSNVRRSIRYWGA